MAGPVLDEVGAAHGPRRHPLGGGTRVGRGLHHAQVVQVPHLVIVLRVRDGRPQHLLDESRGSLRRELQGGERLADRLVPDMIEDQPGLGGGHPDIPGGGAGLHAFPVGDTAAFSADPCALKVRVMANSPSRCPTMFSVTYTGMNFFPLCTASVWPTNSGRMVERRDHVFSTFFWRERFSSSTRRSSRSSTYGPFFSERPIPPPSRLL